MLLNSKEGYDFEMKYYNADGRESSMCGNGGRCLVKFAHDMGIHQTNYHFIAVDGPHDAVIRDSGWVHLKMKDVYGFKNVFRYGSRYGLSHYVKPVVDVKDYDVVEKGREIRYSNDFAKEGINVNFVEAISRGIYVRTYERGVEDETLSCGTGVTASALVFAHNDNGFNRIEIQTRAGTWR